MGAASQANCTLFASSSLYMMLGLSSSIATTYYGSASELSSTYYESAPSLSALLVLSGVAPGRKSLGAATKSSGRFLMGKVFFGGVALGYGIFACACNMYNVLPASSIESQSHVGAPLGALLSSAFRRFHCQALLSSAFRFYLLDWKPLFSSAAFISGAIHTNFSSNASSLSASRAL